MENNEVAVIGKNDVIQPIDMAVITEYLDSTGLTKTLLPKEKAMFIEMAKAYGLNPFKREIYCTAYGEGQYRQCSIVTGYEVYLKRAERIGKLDGWEVTTDGKVSDQTLTATVTIYRKDWTHPFRHTVYFREVSQTKKDGSLNKFWVKQPYFMTKKVAMAQAFRLCFPDEFGGMPYTNDELGVDGENVDTHATQADDARIELEKMIADNRDAFRAEDLEKVERCLADGNAEQMVEMLGWCERYIQWTQGRQ